MAFVVAIRLPQFIECPEINNYIEYLLVFFENWAFEVFITINIRCTLL